MTTIGIDVSKATLDCLWLRDVQTRRIKTRVFKNTPAGHAALVQWAVKQTREAMDSLHFVMEATGIYHEALAQALYTAGARVSVVNPAHIKQYAQSFGRRSKTDKRDSLMIALYGATQQPRLWQPLAPEIRALQALIARLEAVEKDIQREENRLEKAEIASATEAVPASIRSVLGHLRAERRRLIELIEAHIDRHPDLKADRERLESIPGVGPVIARYMMAMLRSHAFGSAAQAAAYLGLVPIHRESGSSVRARSRISKTGKASIRAKLYMAAVVAIQHNPDIQAHYQRLLQKGKSKMAALVAAMRKLVHICFGVIKHQTPYQVQTR
jgi:transposase